MPNLVSKGGNLVSHGGNLAASCNCCCPSSLTSCPNSLTSHIVSGTGVKVGGDNLATKSGTTYNDGLSCIAGVWHWVITVSGCTYTFTNPNTGCPSSTPGNWGLASATGSGCVTGAHFSTITTT